MPTTPVESSTILRDTIFAIKNFLSGAIADPIASNRPNSKDFIMTSYPTKPTVFPLVTIKDVNSFDTQRLGFQSEATQHNIDVEVRVWSNTVALRDSLAGSIHQAMRTNQFGGGSSWATDYDLHDYKLLNSLNIDTPNGDKSKVMTFRFLHVAD